MKVLPFFLIFLAAVADSYAAYIIKLKFNELGNFTFSGIWTYGGKLFSSGLFLSGVFAYVLAPLLGFLALNKLDLSAYYPVSIIFHLVFIIFFAALLGESLSLFKILGIGFLILSLFFLFKG